MNAKHTGDSLAPYRDAVAAHGTTFPATLWASRDMQQTRFEVLTSITSLHNATILDVGAGLGDLAHYCHRHDVTVDHVVGLEGIPEFVEHARQRRIPRATFVQGDFVQHPQLFQRLANEHRYDFALFSGSLNALPPDTATTCVEHAFNHARRGVVFNFLSDKHHRPDHQPTDPDDPARRFSPATLVGFATDRTPLVLFRQDYLDGHDATIAMLKRQPDPTS